MSRSQRLIVAGVLLAGALIYLISTAVSDSTMYYVTVDEVFAQELHASDKAIRMSGEVTDGTIDWSPRDMRLVFEVAGENGGTVRAVYQGPKPDNFVAGSPAILEGRFAADGNFHVDVLMLACPSRFVTEDEMVS